MDYYCFLIIIEIQEFQFTKIIAKDLEESNGIPDVLNRMIFNHETRDKLFKDEELTFC